MNSISRIWIINLQRYPENRQKITSQINSLPDNVKDKFVFFKAIDGREIPDDIEFTADKTWSDPFHKKSITQGEIGCALSHWLLWNKIAKENSYQIILEDDVVITEDFITKLMELDHWLTQTQPLLSLLYLNRKPMESETNVEVIHKDTPKIICPNFSYWMCAYLLSAQGARQLINSDFNHLIIPVDEFLPLISRKAPIAITNKYTPHYNLDPNFNTYACDPPIIKLAPGSFTNSGTMQSEPFFRVCRSTTEFEIWGIGSDATDGRNRFCEYCHVYGLTYRIIGDGVVWRTDMQAGPGGGQKINILKDALSESSGKDDLILVTDTYDVIPVAPESEILAKYNKYVPDRNKVIFSAEKSCWPDKNLANLYPDPPKPGLPKYLNSGGFIGTKGVLWDLLRNDEVSDLSDDQGYWTQKFLVQSNSPNPIIILDYESQIFQTLNGSVHDLRINHHKSNIFNVVTGTTPCLIHGNGPLSIKLQLNNLENYLGNHWNKTYGWVDTYRYQSPIPDTEVCFFIALFGTESHVISKLRWRGAPIDNDPRFIIKIYTPDRTEETGEQSIKDFLATKAQYMFLWQTSIVEITEPEVLDKLSRKVYHKGVVAPLLKDPNSNWSNFWGEISESGWYQRSHDYMEIVNEQRRGLWNVPYINGVIMMQRRVVEHNTDMYQKGVGDAEMKMCQTLRDRGWFMYVDNLEKWGFYGHGEEVTLLDYLQPDKKSAWEQKYLHPEYLEKGIRFSSREVCTDAYTFPLFSSDFCQEIISLAEKHGQWSEGGESKFDPRLGSKENYPTQDIHLKQIGLEQLWDQLIVDHFAQLASHFYAPYKTKKLNIAFVVRYSPEGQKDLAPHHDASTYTLNISLNDQGKDYQGGGCHFIRQGVKHQGQPSGWATIHPGRLTHYHQGLPTTAGVRYILVSFIN